MDNQNSRKDGKLNGWGGGCEREEDAEKEREKRASENQRDELEIAVAVGSQRDGSTLSR